jgi:hypothetical protein
MNITTIDLKNYNALVDELAKADNYRLVTRFLLGHNDPHDRKNSVRIGLFKRFGIRPDTVKPQLGEPGE